MRINWELIEFVAWNLVAIGGFLFILLALSLGPVGERERLEQRKQSVSALRER